MGAGGATRVDAAAAAEGQAMNRSLRLVAVAVGVFGVVARMAAAAPPPPPLTIVPADDPVVAIMVLTANGREVPVLVLDVEDQTTARQVAAQWAGERRCFARERSTHALVRAMESIAGRPCTRIGALSELTRMMWPSPPRVVHFEESDYVGMLRAASLAGNLDAALAPDGVESDLRDAESYVVRSQHSSQGKENNEVTTDAEALAVIRRLRPELHPSAVVVTNPADRNGMFSPSSLSLIAPLVAAAHQAPLLLVSDSKPESVESEVTSFIDAHGLATSHIILVGDEIGLPSHRVPDPVLEAGGPLARGGGKIVRVELFSEIEREKPQDFAVGRIVAENAAQASFSLARRFHGGPPRRGRPAIFLSNADRVFALGEAISRATVADLQNVGVPVRAYYRDEITAEVSQQALAQTDLLVWEGHPRDLTLEERGGVAVDRTPEVVVLQGCYTLDRSDPFILIEKGTQAVIATSAAIYSASGSALARALFDSALGNGTDLGTALRDARNYLLALAELKRQRGHDDWRKTWRAALAFSLWGDPTLKLPIKAGRPTVEPAIWDSKGNELRLTVPKERMRRILVGDYRAQPAFRSMLSGIVWRDPGEQRRSLRDLYFTVAHPTGNDTVACGTEDWAVSSLYAPRSRSLFVLAQPKDYTPASQAKRQEVRFPLRSEIGACATSK